MGLVIHADSQLDLEKLAELLLSKYNIQRQVEQGCCGGTTTINNSNNGSPIIDIDTSLFLITKIFFRVGELNAPTVGANSYQVKDCSGVVISDFDVDIFRERAYQYDGPDYVINTVTSTIFFTRPFIQHPITGEGERVLLIVRPKSAVRNCATSSPSTNSGFPYSLPINL